MKNPEANQLPEVDSLPDGFVESPSEPLYINLDGKINQGTQEGKCILEEQM